MCLPDGRLVCKRDDSIRVGGGGGVPCEVFDDLF